MNIQEIITACADHENALSATRGVLGLRLLILPDFYEDVVSAAESVQRMPAESLHTNVADTAEALAALLSGSNEQGKRVSTQAGVAASALKTVVERQTAAEAALTQAAEAITAFVAAIETAQTEVTTAGDMVHAYAERLGM